MAGASLQPAMSASLAVGNLGLSSYALEVSRLGREGFAILGAA